MERQFIELLDLKAFCLEAAVLSANSATDTVTLIVRIVSDGEPLSATEIVQHCAFARLFTCQVT